MKIINIFFYFLIIPYCNQSMKGYSYFFSHFAFIKIKVLCSHLILQKAVKMPRNILSVMKTRG